MRVVFISAELFALQHLLMSQCGGSADGDVSQMCVRVLLLTLLLTLLHNGSRCEDTLQQRSNQTTLTA